MSTSAIRKPIRKALEVPLAPALVLASMCLDPDDPTRALVGIQNLPIDPTREGVVEYCSISILFAPDKPIEMGQDPRIEGSGAALIIVRVLEGQGPDRPDDIARIVTEAYPYNALLAQDGISVIIGTTDPRTAAQIGPWFTVPISVNWTVYHAEGT